MGVKDLLKEKRQDIMRLAAKYGAANVRIFGSVARGEAGPESDVDFLIDMLEAIRNIEKYAVFGRDRFVEDELVRAYIIHHLQVLGEAAYKLSPELRASHPEVAWPKVLGMRHVLVHDYFRVNYEIVCGV